MESQILIANAAEGAFDGQVYIASCKVATARTGKDYLSGTLADRSGEVDFKVWDNISDFAGSLTRGNFVRVKARVGSFQGKKQFSVQQAFVLGSDEVHWDLFRASPPPQAAESWQCIVDLLGTIENPRVQGFLNALWSTPQVQDKFRLYPAAKSVHHNYPGGLVVHCHSILTILNWLCQHYGPLINRDVLLLGGLLHDIGKCWEMNFDFRCEYTTEGQLLGHIVQGVELVERVNQQASPGLDKMELLHVKHLILSHHGQLDFGSPKVPQTLEAWVLHAVDLLDSKFETFRMAGQEVDELGWAPFNRFLDRPVFNPNRVTTSKEQNHEPSIHRDDVIGSALANLRSTLTTQEKK